MIWYDSLQNSLVHSLRCVTFPLLLQNEVLNFFNISLEGMRDVSSKLMEEFKKGLAKEGDDVVVKMLITYIYSLPDGTEIGDYLNVDLGGSKFRVLLIRKYAIKGK